MRQSLEVARLAREQADWRVSLPAKFLAAMASIGNPGVVSLPVELSWNEVGFVIDAWLLGTMTTGGSSSRGAEPTGGTDFEMLLGVDGKIYQRVQHKQPRFLGRAKRTDCLRVYDSGAPSFTTDALIALAVQHNIDLPRRPTGAT